MSTSYLQDILGDNEEARMALREIPLLRNSSPGLQKLIFKFGRLFKKHKGEILAKEGDFDQWVFFIITGRLGVYVGNDWVDTISSSLVGEKCIFGEPRSVTLKAEPEDMIAIGVDMSLLDLLSAGEMEGPESLEIQIELLSIITGEILKRIAEFEYTIIDISRKYAYYIETEEFSLVLYNLKNNHYFNDNIINRVILDFMLDENKHNYDPHDKAGKLKINTRKFYSRCVTTGRQDLLIGLAGKIHDRLKNERNIVPIRKLRDEEILSYSKFVDLVSATLIQKLDAGAIGEKEKNHLFGTEFKPYLELNDDLNVDLDSLCEWMKSLHGFPEQKIVGALLIILREASDYTALINKQLNIMMNELDRIKTKRLETASSSLHVNVQEYHGNKSAEEMIPFFGIQILESFIINPCLAKTGENADPEMIISESEIIESQKIIDEMFD